MVFAKKCVTVDDLAARIKDISTLPDVALKIVQTVQDPRSDARDLMRVVSSDPSLVARVLKAVNSAAYGLRLRVTNVQHAISYLGFNQVRNLALTASVSRVFLGGDEICGYTRQKLWKHMVSVAVCSRLLACRLEIAAFEDAFLAGLLHDIGIVLEDEHMHDQFVEVIEFLEPQTPLCEAEREVMGFDHTMLGQTLAEQWKFPPLLRAAIGSHHSSIHQRGENATIVRCVEAANVLCTLKRISSVGSGLVRPDPTVFQMLGLGKTDIKVLSEDLDENLRKHDSLFQMQ